MELCVAEVGPGPESDQLYRLTYDGSIIDEPQFVVMGGQTEPIVRSCADAYREDMELAAAVAVALRGLQTAPSGTTNGAAKPATGCSVWASSRSRCWTGPGRGARSAGWSAPR